MTVRQAIEKRRTIRKFTNEPVSVETLRLIIDSARFAAYGANIQPLKFKIITNKEETQMVFDNIKWAGYLKDGTPKEGEKPSAYIAILGDKTLKPSCQFETDAGAAITNMMLCAVELGYDTCWFGSINRETVSDRLQLSDNLQLLYIMAVGKAAQESEVCEIKDGDVKYFLDDKGKLYVPKRSLEEIIVD